MNTDNEICEDIDAVLTGFDHDWSATPTFMRDGIDYRTAHYFWLKGQQSAHEKLLARDVNEMSRMVRAQREDQKI